MNLRFSVHKVTNILLGFEGKDKSKYLWIVKAGATKLGWADRATDGDGGKWVSPKIATSSHGLTAAARLRWAHKLHGITDSQRHGVGVGSGVVGVGEWVSFTVSLSVLPLYSLSRLSILFLFFFFFFLGFFAFSVTPFGLWCWTTDWELSVLFLFFCFFFNRLPGS